jgi:hypothetical protein
MSGAFMMAVSVLIFDAAVAPPAESMKKAEEIRRVIKIFFAVFMAWILSVRG